jgi:hypothetical protein
MILDTSRRNSFEMEKKIIYIVFPMANALNLKEEISCR